jgi:hypothetical protein
MIEIPSLGYTARAAAYANEEKSAITLQTLEAGAVMISAADTPEAWTTMLTQSALAIADCPVAAPPELSVLRAVALSNVEKAVFKQRARFAATTEAVSPLESSERMAYLSAQQMGAPIEPRHYPMLWASVGHDVDMTGDDVADLGAAATLTARREAAWATFEAGLKQKRAAARAAIIAAASAGEISEGLRFMGRET